MHDNKQNHSTSQIFFEFAPEVPVILAWNGASGMNVSTVD